MPTKRWWYVGQLAPKPEPVTVDRDFGPLHSHAVDSNGRSYHHTDHVFGTEADAWRRIVAQGERSANHWPKWIAEAEKMVDLAELRLVGVKADMLADENRLADAIKWLEQASDTPAHSPPCSGKSAPD